MIDVRTEPYCGNCPYFTADVEFKEIFHDIIIRCKNASHCRMLLKYFRTQITLKCIRTNDLADALAGREGVTKTIAEPYEDKTITVNGPAVVLVVED